MIIYTNWIPKPHAGITIGWIILIRPTYRGDSSLILHELVHVSQFKRSWGLFCFQYLLSWRKRWDFENEAYRAQLDWQTRKDPIKWVYYLNLYAGFIASRYRLRITAQEALQRLQN